MYKLAWKTSAEKELRRLPREVVARLLNVVDGLRANPFPPNSRKLMGAEKTYRIRVGDYRLVYTVDGGHLVIEVVAVGHRKDVYR